MNDLFYLLGQAFKYGSIRSLVIIIAGFAASAAFAYSTPYLLQRAIDGLAFRSSFGHFAFFIGLTIAAQGVHVLVRHISRLKKYRERFHIRKKFRLAAYYHMRNLGLPWHNANHSGKTIHVVDAACHALDSFVNTIHTYINIFVSLIVSIGYLFWLDPAMAAVFGGWLSICVLFVFSMNKKLARLWDDLHFLNQKISKLFLDYVSNIRTVLSLRLGRKTQDNLSRAHDDVYPTLNKSIRTNENKWSFLVFGVLLLNNCLMLYFVWTQFNADAAFDFGALVALRLYLSMGAEGFFDFADTYDKIVEHAVAVRQADAILTRSFGDGVPKGKRYGINSFAINKMFFQHRDSEIPNLTISGVPFMARRGRRIALVGESGSGKSTMMLLVRGLLSPKSVECDINDKTCDCMSQLSAQSVLIPQDPEFFEDTIEYNITVGGKYAKSQIDGALKMSRFDVVLARLPKGLKTGLFEKGVNLSGGEKQRLALARGILAAQSRDIVFLDESTSSVDAENERIIYGSIFKKFKNKFVIASVHKLNLLDHFDEIYVFGDRRIVQHGTLEELLSERGQFQKIWKKYNRNKK